MTVLDPVATYELRRRVLRDGDPGATVAFDGDDEAGTLHLGVTDGGALLGVSSWYWRDFPEDPTDRDRQLRGMAVDSSRQRRGAGAVLLAAGVDRALADGATTVWARARDSALGFYERNGFEVVGDGFVDLTTSLPHHLIRRRP